MLEQKLLSENEDIEQGWLLEKKLNLPVFDDFFSLQKTVKEAAQEVKIPELPTKIICEYLLEEKFFGKLCQKLLDSGIEVTSRQFPDRDDLNLIKSTVQEKLSQLTVELRKESEENRRDLASIGCMLLTAGSCFLGYTQVNNEIIQYLFVTCGLFSATYSVASCFIPPSPLKYVPYFSKSDNNQRFLKLNALVEMINNYEYFLPFLLTDEKALTQTSELKITIVDDAITVDAQRKRESDSAVRDKPTKVPGSLGPWL